MAWPLNGGEIRIPRLNALRATELAGDATLDTTEPLLATTGDVIITMHRITDEFYEWMVGMDWDAHTLVYARRALTDHEQAAARAASAP